MAIGVCEAAARIDSVNCKNSVVTAAMEQSSIAVTSFMLLACTIAKCPNSINCPKCVNYPNSPNFPNSAD